MEDRAILGIFVFGTVAAVFLCMYFANRRWEKMGYHDELNSRKQVKEKWELRGSRKKK